MAGGRKAPGSIDMEVKHKNGVARVEIEPAHRYFPKRNGLLITVNKEPVLRCDSFAEAEEAASKVRQIVALDGDWEKCRKAIDWGKGLR